MLTRNNKIQEKLSRVSRTVFRVLRKRSIVRAAKDPVLRIALVPNKELRRLKKKLLRKDVKVVDVLAFPDKGDFPHPESKVPPLGEVLINQAIARKDFPRAAFLLIHGILHLLGYRHSTKRDTIIMQNLEQKLLAEVTKSKIFNF